MDIVNYANGVKLIKDFINQGSCLDFIDRGESMGFDEAAINTGRVQEIVKDIRNNDRIFFDDHALADELFLELRNHAPAQLGHWSISGLNERFRFYRYEKGQYFKWHRDGSFIRNGDEESRLTFMIYLNDNYQGGQTDFRSFTVKPIAGAALIFPHFLMHQGSPIESGVKYILRTDVMYHRA